MKKRLITAVAAFCAAVLLLETGVSAESPSYSVSEDYAEGEYYSRLSQVELTGDWRTDIVNVALSQLGYHEGDSKRDLDGGFFPGRENYTEYGSLFYGVAAEWCAMFVSWCARQAGIPRRAINDASLAATDGVGGEREYFFHIASRRRDKYDPIPGDIVFFSSSGYGTDHVGIVVGLTDTGILTVEGNKLNAVRLNCYDYDSDYIVRYGYYTTQPWAGDAELEYTKLSFVHNEGMYGLIPGYDEEYEFDSLLAPHGRWFSLPPNAYERAGHRLLGYCAERTDTGLWYCKDGWRSYEELLAGDAAPRVFGEGTSFVFEGELAEAEEIRMYCLWERSDGRVICDSAMPSFDRESGPDWINPYQDAAGENWFFESIVNAGAAGAIDEPEVFRLGPDFDADRAAPGLGVRQVLSRSAALVSPQKPENGE